MSHHYHHSSGLEIERRIRGKGNKKLFMSLNVVCETIGYFNGLLDFRDSVLLPRDRSDGECKAREPAGILS